MLANEITLRMLGRSVLTSSSLLKEPIYHFTPNVILLCNAKNSERCLFLIDSLLESLEVSKDFIEKCDHFLFDNQVSFGSINDCEQGLCLFLLKAITI